jgi:hypothetical protein
MKRVYLFYAGLLILVSLAVLIVLQRGAVIRTAPLIKVQSSWSFEKLAQQVSMRTFPDWNEAQEVLWYSSLQAHELTTLLEKISPELLAKSKFIQLSRSLEQQLDLSVLNSQDQVLHLLFLPFSRDLKLSEVCKSQKLMDLTCVKESSVAEVRRKFKSKEKVFFARKYLENLIFVFYEQE